MIAISNNNYNNNNNQHTKNEYKKYELVGILVKKGINLY